MATIPELLNGHVTLEVECPDRLYLNGYIGGPATPGGLVTFMRVQLDKPIPSPVLLGQVTERFREAVKVKTERDGIPVYRFNHKERKDDIANDFRRRRGVRDDIVFIGIARDKAKAFSGARRRPDSRKTGPARSASHAPHPPPPSVVPQEGWATIQHAGRDRQRP